MIDKYDNNEDDLYSMQELIGPGTKDVRPLLILPRSSWIAGVKSGEFPKPVNKDEWRKSDIDQLLADNPGLIANQKLKHFSLNHPGPPIEYEIDQLERYDMYKKNKGKKEFSE